MLAALSHAGTRYEVQLWYIDGETSRILRFLSQPALKATFDITLIVPTELTALSNMNVVSEKPYLAVEKGTEFGKHEQSGKDVGDANKWKEVKFAVTPPMSTYLVAFVVGPFEYIEAFTTGEHNGHPIRTRVYTLPGSVEQGRHALNVATKAIEYFAKVFGEPYPLPKIDMVAIPDFEAGEQ